MLEGGVTEVCCLVVGSAWLSANSKAKAKDQAHLMFLSYFCSRSPLYTKCAPV